MTSIPETNIIPSAPPAYENLVKRLPKSATSLKVTTVAAKILFGVAVGAFVTFCASNSVILLALCMDETICSVALYSACTAVISFASSFFLWGLRESLMYQDPHELRMMKKKAIISTPEEIVRDHGKKHMYQVISEGDFRAKLQYQNGLEFLNAQIKALPVDLKNKSPEEIQEIRISKAQLKCDKDKVEVDYQLRMGNLLTSLKEKND